MHCSDLKSDPRKSEALTHSRIESFKEQICEAQWPTFAVFSARAWKPALLINDAWGSRVVVPRSGGGMMGGGVSAGMRVWLALWSCPRVREAASLTAEILSVGLASHELALINQSMCGSDRQFIEME